jgi:4-hydroxybenzoate polyprenyltransferase
MVPRHYRTHSRRLECDASMKGHPHSIVGIFLLLVLLVINSSAVITVNGIADQEIDQASFTVPSEAGFTIVA